LFVNPKVACFKNLIALALLISLTPSTQISRIFEILLFLSTATNSSWSLIFKVKFPFASLLPISAPIFEPLSS
jgi:hypothetical protein